MLNSEKVYKISEKKERINVVILNQLDRQLIDYGTNVVVINLGDQGLYLRSQQIKKVIY